MKKAIVVLTGTPTGKNRLSEIILRKVWKWDINPKNLLTKIAREKFYWKGERNEEFYKFLSEMFSLVNKNFGFEENYILDYIRLFENDKDEEKLLLDKETGEVQAKFENFLLVIHGISKELTTRLKDEFGALVVQVTDSELNTQVYNTDGSQKTDFDFDYVLYENDADFVTEAEKLLSVLFTGEK